MKVEDAGVLTSVKGSFFRQRLVVALGSAALVVLLGLNVLAFVRGLQTPWLLGGVIIADMLVIGLGILFAAREVLQADSRTEASKAHLEAIVDSAMDAIVTVDEAQNILLFNRAAEQIFRCPRGEALGEPLERFLPPRFRAAHRGHIEHFARTGVTSRRMGDVTLLWGLRADGEEFPIEASISQARAAGGRYFTVILRDITLRRQAEAEAERVRGALGEAQRRLGAIVDSAMDAVITVDEEQKIMLFNRAAEQVFRVGREAMIGTPLDRLLPARFRAAHRGHIEGFGRTGVTSRRMGDVTTLWALRPESGEEFPIEASISQAAHDGRRFYTVILRDITLRKQAEDALRESQRELRELSARVLEAREEEKAHIARELHDELGQLLTALKMDLGWVRERLPADGEIASRAKEMSGLLDRTVGATRRISADLRPLMLDDLGLADAAAWLVDDFAKRSGLACSIDLPQEMPQLSKSVGTAVYRAIQESLTNIARHAGAKSAWVILAVEGGALHVEVEDDGRGIAPEDLAKARSLGLKGMRERIGFLGGSLEIARAPRGGTRLRLRVPLQGLREGAA
jgi:PAS domain S-box-containing protein